MKRLLFLFLLIPLLAFSQDDVYDKPNQSRTDTMQYVIDKYLVDGKTVTYVFVNELKGLSVKDIKALLARKITADPKFATSQSIMIDDQIDGYFKNIDMDFKKYGFTRLSLPVWILHPFDGSFTIQIKDGKYRVIVKAFKSIVQYGMEFDFNKDFVDKNGKLASSQKEIMRKAYYLLGKTFEEWFTVKPTKKDDW